MQGKRKKENNFCFNCSNWNASPNSTQGQCFSDQYIFFRPSENRLLSKQKKQGILIRSSPQTIYTTKNFGCVHHKIKIL